MTSTRIETLSLTDGRELRVTIAEPDSAVRGGLVVLHEARGITAGVRSLVSSLAAEGWLAIAPHLYDADRVHGDDIRDQVSKLSGDRLLEDTDVAFVWLGQQGVSADRRDERFDQRVDPLPARGQLRLEQRADEERVRR